MAALAKHRHHDHVSLFRRREPVHFRGCRVDFRFYRLLICIDAVKPASKRADARLQKGLFRLFLFHRSQVELEVPVFFKSVMSRVAPQLMNKNGSSRKSHFPRLGVEVLESRAMLAAIALRDFGQGIGEHSAIDLQQTLTASNPNDIFSLELRKGDILNVAANRTGGDRAPDELLLRDRNGQLLMHTNDPVPLSARSPLLPGGDAGLAYVVSTSGTYEIEANSLSGGWGSYLIQFRVFRPALERQPSGTVQTLFLDFDGATINPYATFREGVDQDVDLPGISAYLVDYGLVSANASAAQFAAVEDRLVQRIVDTVVENLQTDVRRRGVNGNYAATRNAGEFDIHIVDSRGSFDPWGGPHVSRIIIGGSNFDTAIIGDTAESNDPGNMVTDETGLVQFGNGVHLTTGPNRIPISPRIADQQAAQIDLLGVYFGNIVSHEAGHLFGAYHTAANGTTNIMDQAKKSFLGPDGVYGTQDDVDVDFGVDAFDDFTSESYATFTRGGRASNLDWISVGLSTGKATRGDGNNDGLVNSADLNVVARNWMSNVAPWSEGDLNGDGTVNTADLHLVGLNWGYGT